MRFGYRGTERRYLGVMYGIPINKKDVVKCVWSGNDQSSSLLASIH